MIFKPGIIECAPKGKVLQLNNLISLSLCWCICLLPEYPYRTYDVNSKSIRHACRSSTSALEVTPTHLAIPVGDTRPDLSKVGNRVSAT